MKTKVEKEFKGATKEVAKKKVSFILVTVVF
jgi:hypothetical protein